MQAGMRTVGYIVVGYFALVVAASTVFALGLGPLPSLAAAAAVVALELGRLRD